MGQIDNLDIFRPAVPQVETVELPKTGLAVFEDQARFRDGDILPPEAERVDAKLPLALRGIDLNRITSRADLMAALTAGLPLNEYHMPKFLYRADLLDVSLFAGEANGDQDARYREMQDTLNSAMIPLCYHEGYAAFEDGSPLWAQMEPFEGSGDFAVFQNYLQLPGARQLSLLPAYTTTTSTGPVEQRLSSLFHTNYWALRAKAHDVFAVVHAQRMREQRILKTTDKHFLKAEELFNKLMTYAGGIKWEELEDPKAYVEVMERLTKIQRTALGLSVHGNSKDEEAKTPSIEVIMRTLTRQSVEGVEVTRSTEADVDVQKLLENPEALEQAQELILKFGSKG